MKHQAQLLVPFFLLVSILFFITSIVFSTKLMANKAPVQATINEVSKPLQLAHRRHHWHRHPWRPGYRPPVWHARWYYWTGWRPHPHRFGCYKRYKIHRYNGSVIGVRVRCW